MRQVLLFIFLVAVALLAAGVVFFGGASRNFVIAGSAPRATSTAPSAAAAPATVNVAIYNAKMLALANEPPRPRCATSIQADPAATSSSAPPAPLINAVSGTVTTTTSTMPTTTIASSSPKTSGPRPCAPRSWPVSGLPYPDAGAVLPFARIVAYYGNFYSTQMGILGEFPVPEVLARLASTTAMWAAADTSTPVLPALDYIAVAAQSSAGPDGMYRLRMPTSQIEKAIGMANQINGLVFLDIQIGLSSVETEVPLLAQYLKLPNVELSIDPEFAMHNGARPGTVIGSLDAADINFATQFLANIVRENNLPPKILVIHRFTQPMVTNYKKIMPPGEVQILMDMDGFGTPSNKLSTYADFIAAEPVQFTGFKLFYKNDVSVGGRLMTPPELLRLTPRPSYIQYQ